MTKYEEKTGGELDTFSSGQEEDQEGVQSNYSSQREYNKATGMTFAVALLRGSLSMTSAKLKSD